MAHHVIDGSRTHAFFDNSVPPQLEIDSGDTVTFELREPLDGQVTPETRPDQLLDIDGSRAHSLLGPVAIRGTTPGDTLEVEILAFEHHDWGWTGWLPGMGLLADDFPEAHIQHWRIEADLCRFADSDAVAVPFAPFCGVMGVAPAEPGRFDTLPPRRNGGNVDVRHLTVGARAFLPVLTHGAGFATGDGHAAQGDGEVCGSAIEAPLTTTLRFHRRTDLSVSELQFHTPGPLIPNATGGFHVTTDHGTDLYACAQGALRRGIDWLESEHGLTRHQAYCLCSAAADLKISEVVNPSYVVSLYLPLAVLTSPS